MQVLSATDSLVDFSFRFSFEKLVIFAVYLTLRYGGFPFSFPIFFNYYLFDSSVFAKHSVNY